MLLGNVQNRSGLDTNVRNNLSRELIAKLRSWHRKNGKRRKSRFTFPLVLTVLMLIKSNDNSFDSEINSPFPNDLEIASSTIVFERISESTFIAVTHFKSFSNEPPVGEQSSSFYHNHRNGSEFESWRLSPLPGF
jgi:hypothetical protein